MIIHPLVSLSLFKVLAAKSIPQTEKFLRESHKYLCEHLCELKTEYVEAVRQLGKATQSTRVHALQEKIQSSDLLQTELRDVILGNRNLSSVFDVNWD